MKTLSLLFCLCLLFSCCPEKPEQIFFTQSSEIDLTNQLVDAYQSGDWTTYRSFFSDTVKIWHNVPLEDDFAESIDEHMDATKAFLANITSYRIDWFINEMVTDGDRGNWVYTWGKWVGKFAENREEVVVMFHRAFLIKDGKIVEDGGFWNNLPFYLEEQQLKALNK